MEKINLMNFFMQYISKLKESEKSKNTIDKYARDIQKFIDYTYCEKLTKEVVLAFKKDMIAKYKTASVNSILVAVNGFLEFSELSDMRVGLLKVQREIFASPERELSKSEYERLVKTAEKKANQQLALILQAICSSGMRVSELQFLTVSAVHSRQIKVCCKNKNRTVFLHGELCQKLKEYCKARGISSGIVFKTKSGKPLDRSNIWKMMKDLCKTAGVAKSKVFPHNLRHLFARTYYKLEKDIARLADILGHSNINTTRIYTIESGKTHQRQINKMKLLL